MTSWNKFFSLATKLVLAFCFSVTGNPLKAQVYGCTDPFSNNYNPSATINNGTCTYNPKSYSPVPKVDPLSNVLIENSGLQMAANFLWTFNDGGGAAALYRIDTLTNIILQTVQLSGATNIDWEDIAFDGNHFYIGDFGNNSNGARTDLKIYKFPLSVIPDHVSNPVVNIPAGQISVIHFSYSDQPQPTQPTTNNNTKYDCEAMIVDKGKIHLFTKNWIGLNSTHYEINSTAAGTYIAMPLETLETNFLVTAADKPPGLNIVALLGYQTTGFYNHFMYLLTAYNDGLYFNGNKRKIDLPGVLQMGQAEGLSFRTGTYGYISNEKVASFFTVNQKLQGFDIGGMISNATTSYIFNGNGNWDVAANWSFGLVPPAVPAAGSEIFIDPSPGGQCILNIPYDLPADTRLIVKPLADFVLMGNLILQ